VNLLFVFIVERSFAASALPPSLRGRNIVTGTAIHLFYHFYIGVWIVVCENYLCFFGQSEIYLYKYKRKSVYFYILVFIQVFFGFAHFYLKAAIALATPILQISSFKNSLFFHDKDFACRMEMCTSLPT
jgi:hypothetical protein